MILWVSIKQNILKTKARAGIELTIYPALFFVWKDN